MPRLVVVLPLTPLRTGQSFAVHEWPLHVTVLAPFSTDAPPSAIAHVIASALSGQPAIPAVAGGDELFGRRHDVPVTVVEENDALSRVHTMLVDSVRPFASSPNERAFTGPEFRPHVTAKHHGRVHPGDHLVLTQIALVDMAPRSAPGGRSVLATRDLPAPPAAGTAADCSAPH